MSESESDVPLPSEPDEGAAAGKLERRVPESARTADEWLAEAARLKRLEAEYAEAGWDPAVVDPQFGANEPWLTVRAQAQYAERKAELIGRPFGSPPQEANRVDTTLSEIEEGWGARHPDVALSSDVIDTRPTIPAQPSEGETPEATPQPPEQNPPSA